MVSVWKVEYGGGNDKILRMFCGGLSGGHRKLAEVREQEHGGIGSVHQ